MKKIVALAIVCGFAVAMVSCTQKKTEETESVTTKTDSLSDSTINAAPDSVAEPAK